MLHETPGEGVKYQIPGGARLPPPPTGTRAVLDQGTPPLAARKRRSLWSVTNYPAAPAVLSIPFAATMQLRQTVAVAADIFVATNNNSFDNAIATNCCCCFLCCWYFCCHKQLLLLLFWQFNNCFFYLWSIDACYKVLILQVLAYWAISCISTDVTFRQSIV